MRLEARRVGAALTAEGELQRLWAGKWRGDALTRSGEPIAALSSLSVLVVVEWRISRAGGQRGLGHGVCCVGVGHNLCTAAA